MPTETGFNTDWLTERYAFDCKARNKEVEQACCSFLKEKQSLSIVDIGSGSGSSCLYLMQLLPQDQQWTFVELNPQLARASLERLESFATQNNWYVHSSETQLSIETPDKKIEIEVINNSFLELETIIDLTTVDLVTAAAVFDLLSLDMLEKFLRLLMDYKVALLATINYEGMRFKPEQPGDLHYADLYGNHMQRAQPFGVSLGPDCSRKMMDFYHRHNVKAVGGPSNWEVNSSDMDMHHFLFEYMENAIPEMLDSGEEQVHFFQWLKGKKRLLNDKDLVTEVLHFDIFVL